MEYILIFNISLQNFEILFLEKSKITIQWSI